MRILRIKNYEKYQNHRAKDPRWVKLYRTILTDQAFIRLDPVSRYIYIGLVILASETGNSIVNDVPYLCHRLAIPATQLNLKPLICSGLIVASLRTIQRQKSLSETETEKSRDRVETETEAEVMKAAAPSVLSRLENFSITPDIEAWAAKEEISSVHAYLEEFKDYWRTVGGKRKSGQEIKDWPAAFKNRLRDLKKSGKLKTVNVWGD